MLDLDPAALLSTTRAVRKRLDLDRPVGKEVLDRCLELATQAPTGSNQQGWHFVVVTDEAKRAALAELYGRAWEMYKQLPQAAANLEFDSEERTRTQARVMASAQYLADHLHRVPVHVVPCIEGRFDGGPTIAHASMWGSICPAIWSFMLAARAHGLGSSWTTLHLFFEQEAAEVLGIPYDEVTQAALVPVAYTKGTDFKPGPRQPLDQVVHRESW